MSGTQKITIYFVGGSKKEFLVDDADSVSEKLKSRAWVSVNKFEVDSSKITHFKVTNFEELEEGNYDPDDDYVYS